MRVNNANAVLAISAIAAVYSVNAARPSSAIAPSFTILTIAPVLSVLAVLAILDRCNSLLNDVTQTIVTITDVRLNLLECLYNQINIGSYLLLLDFFAFGNGLLDRLKDSHFLVVCHLVKIG